MKAVKRVDVDTGTLNGGGIRVTSFSGSLFWPSWVLTKLSQAWPTGEELSLMLQNTVRLSLDFKELIKTTQTYERCEYL